MREILRTFDSDRSTKRAGSDAVGFSEDTVELPRQIAQAELRIAPGLLLLQVLA